VIIVALTRISWLALWSLRLRIDAADVRRGIVLPLL